MFFKLSVHKIRSRKLFSVTTIGIPVRVDNEVFGQKSKYLQLGYRMKYLAIMCVFLAGWIGLYVTATYAETIFEKWPIVIACERGQTTIVGYLSTVKEDGSAIYQTTGARRTIVVAADGKIRKTASMSEGLSCVGRSIEELREKGMTFNAIQQ
jgi:hypothetical protein